MKFISSALFLAILSFYSITLAKVQDMNNALASATSKQKSDLAKLLSQLTLVPTKAKQNGRALFKVTKVEKGSMWERLGWRVGDLVIQ